MDASESAALEAAFTTELFRNSCKPFVVFCGIWATLMPMLAIASPESAPTNLLAAAYALGWLLVRLRLDRMDDQQQARRYFGRRGLNQLPHQQHRHRHSTNPTQDDHRLLEG